jgi:hypothetical protein
LQDERRGTRKEGTACRMREEEPGRKGQLEAHKNMTVLGVPTCALQHKVYIPHQVEIRACTHKVSKRKCADLGSDFCLRS